MWGSNCESDNLKSATFSFHRLKSGKNQVPQMRISNWTKPELDQVQIRTTWVQPGLNWVTWTMDLSISTFLHMALSILTYWHFPLPRTITPKHSHTTSTTSTHRCALPCVDSGQRWQFLVFAIILTCWHDILAFVACSTQRTTQEVRSWNCFLDIC